LLEEADAEPIVQISGGGGEAAVISGRKDYEKQEVYGLLGRNVDAAGNGRGGSPRSLRKKGQQRPETEPVLAGGIGTALGSSGREKRLIRFRNIAAGRTGEGKVAHTQEQEKRATVLAEVLREDYKRGVGEKVLVRQTKGDSARMRALGGPFLQRRGLRSHDGAKRTIRPFTLHYWQEKT